MASRNLFTSPQTRGRTAVPASTTNRAGGKAYSRSSESTLAQLAATGCLSRTNTSANQQLDEVKTALQGCDPRFIAQVAVYSRQRGYMKDMPALLCAYLAAQRQTDLLKKVFPLVIDNGKMLRNFVQILRSGQFGRRSLGTAPRKLVRNWLDSKSDAYLFRATVGNNPSLADIIKMVHPKAQTAQRSALYAYIIGRTYDTDSLPELVQEYEAWKRGAGQGVPPKVEFRQLTGLKLNSQQWAQIAHDGGWHMVKMNLNTFQRQGVFDIAGMDTAIAAKLADKELIAKSKVFPYQLLTAYLETTDVPHVVREALQDALELATANVPAFNGKVYVFPDTSGSMSQPVTGYRSGAPTTTARCIDVAALISAVVLRNNKSATVIPFAIACKDASGLNPRDSIMTNAEKLKALGGGGTNCAAPLTLLNRQKAKGDLVIYISDNESWCGANDGVYRHHYRRVKSTETLKEWEIFKARNPQAKMVTIDITPSTTSQVEDSGREDILRIGGFSDRVFDVIGEFASGDTGPEYWLKTIKAINLDTVQV